MNRVEITARVEAAPARRVTSKGTTVAQLRVAIPRLRAHGEGNGADTADVVAFGGLAEACLARLRTGSQIAVSGHLRAAPDGRLEIWADAVENLNRRPATGDTGTDALTAVDGAHPAELPA